MTPLSAEREKAILISRAIAGLAPVYYRPDFGEAQAKLLFAAFVEDLSEFPMYLIEGAIRVYRRNSENKFFPTPAQLRAICLEDRPSTRSAMTQRPLPEARPIFWWMLTRWKPGWSESQIPQEHREAYEAVKASRALANRRAE